MPTSVSKTVLFTGNAPIKFSDLSSTFRDGKKQNIKFSDYKRDTSLDATSPVVPDATENEGISTADTNLKISGFRNCVTSYDVVQTGTDATLDLGSSTLWNGNLNRNIIKKASIEGICHATTTSNYGIQLEAETYNLRMNISGNVYGEGGTLQSPNGGGALYVRNTTNRSAKTTLIDISLNSTARVWAGGGAGTTGNAGFAGPAISCSSTNTFTTSNPYTGGRSLADAKPGRSCRRSRSGATWYAANPNSTRTRCRGASPRRGESGYQCSPHWTVYCKQTNYYTVQGNAGFGGSGGVGRGWSTLNSSIDGNPGNPGNSSSCGGSSSTGNRGNPGSRGGEWGEDSSGKKGPAIVGNPSYYRLRGDSTTNLKGSIRNI